MTDRKLERTQLKKLFKEKKKTGEVHKTWTFNQFVQMERLNGSMLRRYNTLKKLENERVSAGLSPDANKAIEDMFFTEADAFSDEDDMAPIEITFDEK